MPGESTRLTDELWLAAYDSVGGRPQISDWPLGVGLATGLLAELITGGFLELRGGELFRTTPRLPEDRALYPVLVKMGDEELARQSEPSPAPVGANTRMPMQDGQYWAPPARGEHRHTRRGHDLRTWISYLAYERRAEDRVVDRLSRTGLVKLKQRRRWFHDPTVRFVPRDPNVAISPASSITTALRRGLRLTRQQLLLTGLFFVTGLHHHALATLEPPEHALLADLLAGGVDAMSQELLRAADAAVGEAAMR